MGPRSTLFRRTGPDDIIKEVDQALNAVTRGKVSG